MSGPFFSVHAARESISSGILFFLTSFFSRSNHITSTVLSRMYRSTSITLPSILLLTRSPFLKSLLLIQFKGFYNYMRNEYRNSLGKSSYVPESVTISPSFIFSSALLSSSGEFTGVSLTFVMMKPSRMSV